MIEIKAVRDTRKCPECGEYYASPPALSRKDNKTYICPRCGTMDALNVLYEYWETGQEAAQLEKEMQMVDEYKSQIEYIKSLLYKVQDGMSYYTRDIYGLHVRLPY